MHAQPRDALGRFTQVPAPQPSRQSPPPTPTPAPAPTSHIQRLLDFARTPVVGAIHLTNTVVALTYSPPNSCLHTPLPPPRYTSNPPISQPAFNASGSEDSDSQEQLPAPVLPEFDLEAQQPANLEHSDIAEGDKPYEILHPPQPQPITPHQIMQHPLFSTEIPPLHRSSPPLPPIPQPPATMSRTLTRGAASMPSP